LIATTSLTVETPFLLGVRKPGREAATCEPDLSNRHHDAFSLLGLGCLFSGGYNAGMNRWWRTTPVFRRDQNTGEQADAAGL
jgi:hypothetical protein